VGQDLAQEILREHWLLVLPGRSWPPTSMADVGDYL
jgi:hypothetical protein